MKSMKWIVPLGIIFSGFVLAAILAGMREDPPKRQPQVRPKIVDARVVNLVTTYPEIRAFGTLTTTQPLQLISEVNGILERGGIPFQAGRSFKKGDLLIKVDERQAELNVKSLKSDFLNAMAAVLPEIKIDFPDRFQRWQNYFNSVRFDQELPPMPEVDDQKLKLYLARFNIYKLYYAIRQAEINLEKHFFYAPFNGTIQSADLHIGSAARNGSRLGTILNLEKMEVRIPIPVNQLAFVDRERPVKLRSAETGQSWQGQLSRISQSIDERTQSIDAFIEIDTPRAEGLYEGIFLNAGIPVRPITGSSEVPRYALYDDNKVYLIRDGKLFYQEVDIAIRLTNSAIVNGGLSNGDTLVTELLQGVAPGMPASARLLGLAEGAGQ